MGHLDREAREEAGLVLCSGQHSVTTGALGGAAQEAYRAVLKGNSRWLRRNLTGAIGVRALLRQRRSRRSHRSPLRASVGADNALRAASPGSSKVTITAFMGSSSATSRTTHSLGTRGSRPSKRRTPMKGGLSRWLGNVVPMARVGSAGARKGAGWPDIRPKRPPGASAQ